MALTQSARLPGPSWDEEVVPALRKRLESESRTLSHRMSAISLSSSVEDLSAAFTKPASIRNQHNDYRLLGSSSQSPGPGYHSTFVDHPTTPSTSTRVNGVQSARKPVATSFHRSRTYSQPYATDNDSSQMNGSARARPNTGKAGSALRSARSGDPKPTRIPKVSRTSNTPSSPPLPSLNGSATGGVGYFPPITPSTTSMQTRYSSDSRSHNPPASNSSQVNLGPVQPHRIINEPAPFNTATSSNSSIYNIHDVDAFGSRPKSRDSIDSEERPFEHWYRGEVSRNGGVGELRVGKRQEMLEIANFGHAISNKRKAVASRKAALVALEDSRRVRKRADSIGGITMRDRGSLYLDEERAAQVGRVLDEDPLTDLEWEGSDIGSISTHNHSHSHYHHHRFSNHNADPDFIPGVGDVTTTTSTSFTDTPMTSYEDERSYTPTQTARTTPTPTSTPRPKLRKNSSSSRIPTVSSERISSESKVSTATQHSFPKGQIPPQPQPVVDLTTVTGVPSPPPTNPRSPTPSSTKRGVSPGPNSATTANISFDGASSAKKARIPTPTTPQKRGGVRPKPKSAMKKVVKEEDDRKSVAHYPTPGDDGSMDMADAIPSWTQPKPREGNWDDVVLPVVARKKGLEDYYEKADGSPRPKRQEPAPVAPAPGTFGYDDTKYRRGRADEDEIEMDEFGRPKGPDTTTITEDNTANANIPEEPEPQEEEVDKHRPPPVSTAHDNIRVPVNNSPPISPPFSDYAPTTVQDIQYSATSVGDGKPGAVVEQDEGGAGCCKCVVM